MRIQSHRPVDDSRLEPVGEDDALRALQDGSPIWVHVDEFSRDELGTLLKRVPITPFMRNRLLRVGESTKVVPSKQATMMELRIIQGQSAASATINHLAVLITPNGLITIECDPFEGDRPGPSIVKDLHELELIEPTSMGILLSLLVRQANDLAAIIREIRRRVYLRDEDMDRDPSSVSLEEILDLRDDLLNLLAVADEQNEAFSDFSEIHSPDPGCESLRGTIGLLVSVSASTERLANRLERRLADMRQRYDILQQEKVNHRLAILTILSAIFLPLTLIAGIWGMNFHSMPELKSPYGYPLALASMALIAILMLAFFYRRGWFR